MKYRKVLTTVASSVVPLVKQGKTLGEMLAATIKSI